jgi:L-threonylcarbamoyladenylate synthase
MEKAIETLKNGGVILYPTDTIWGIGCDATNEAACQKISQIKNRPENKSFIILVDSIQMIEKYIPEFPDVCYDLVDLADKPLTIIYPNAKGLAPSILADDGSVGIRVTKDPICLKLIRSMRKPLVSTSANLSGEANPSCFADVNQQVKDKVDAIVMEKLDVKNNVASQIIKIGLNYSIQVIRK